MGIGYLTRNAREAEFQEKSDVDTLGEAEFLSLFAEAVVSGRKVDGVDGVSAKSVIDMSEIEIGSGIPAFESRHKDTIKFYHDPRFGNLKTPEQRGDSADAGGSRLSVKELLAAATTMEEVQDIISRKSPCLFALTFHMWSSGLVLTLVVQQKPCPRKCAACFTFHPRRASTHLRHCLTRASIRWVPSPWLLGM